MPPQRWVIDANWKTGADNFVGGDGYHTVMTHRSMCELGLLPPDNVAVSPAHVSLSGGHGGGRSRRTTRHTRTAVHGLSRGSRLRSQRGLRR